MLPDHDVVIFDEAHELRRGHDVESRGGGHAGPVPFALVALRPVLWSSRATPICWTRWPRSVTSSAQLLGDRVGTRVLHDVARPPVDDSELAALITRAAEISRRVTDALRRGGAQRSFLPDDAGSEPEPDRASRKTRALQAAAHMAEDLHRFEVAERRRGGLGRWLDAAQRPAPPLPHRRGPRALGDALGRGHLRAHERHHPAPHCGAGRAGLVPYRRAQRRRAPSSYRSHSLLYVARHLPDRRAAGAEEALHEELSQLVEAAGGRTLALFTSKRATEAAAAVALAPEVPYTLLTPGDLPKSLLLEKFATDETSCLFATMGFWQGVDIPGGPCRSSPSTSCPSPVPTTRCSAGAPGPGRRRRLLARRSAPAPPPCWPRAPAD